MMNNNKAVEQHLAAASLNAMQGNWRECAESYLAGHTAAAGHPLRYCFWSGFTSVLKEGHFSASARDLASLKTTSKDLTLTTLERTQAQFTRGYLRWASGDREAAVRDYRRAISMAEATPAIERHGSVLLPNEEERPAPASRHPARTPHRNCEGELEQLRSGQLSSGDEH